MIFRNLNNPNVPISTALFNMRPNSSSGVHISESNATQLSAIYRAREVKAEAIAGSPVRVFDTNGFLQQFSLFDEPHPDMTWFELCDMIVTHMMFHGNFYALKTTTAGRVTSLSPLHPRKVTPKWIQDKSGRLIERVYEVQVDGERTLLNDDDLFHIPGGSFDGLKGLSMLEEAAQSLGTAAASEQFAGAFYGNGNMSSGILTTENRLKEEEADRLKSRWKEKIQGLDNAHDIIVLDNGATFQSMSINPVEAQFLEAREHNIAEAARWTGVVPRLLMQTGDVGGRLIEQDGLEFSTYGLRGTVRRIESRFTQFILPKGQRMDINLADFERADAKTRSGAALLARKASVKSINDLRLEDNMPLIDDPRADDPFYAVGGEGAGPESGGGDVGGETADQGGSDDDSSGINGAGSETITVKEQNMTEAIVALQKIYLSVGTVISSAEARRMISTFGFDLPGDIPVDEPEPEAGLEPDPEADADPESDDPDSEVS